MAGEMWKLEKTALGEAIMSGDPFHVRRLIEEGENVHLRDRKGNTYLHYVCTIHRPYVFNILCAFGVPLNAQNIHGNTALHVTALHSECCHVPDLMQCGVDPYITNNDGKTARDLAKNNNRWTDLHDKYEPTLMHAVRNHDLEGVTSLFETWSAVHLPLDLQNGFNMRNYSAALTYHDIVSMIDGVRFSLMAVFSIKECDYKSLEYALSRGREMCDVNYLQRIKGHPPHHMLQHAVRLNDIKMVDMLLKAGADLNIQVLIHEYIRGPLFFEVLRTDQKVCFDIIRRIIAADVDLEARDERGRTALIYCIDRKYGNVTMEIINLLLEKGINIALRDNTGCTAREVALFARRHDIVTAIDEYLIELIRSSDLAVLQNLVQNGYGDLFIEHMSRAEMLHSLSVGASQSEIQAFIEASEDGDSLLQYRDKAGRGLFLNSVLYGKLDTAQYLLSTYPHIVQSERDNNNRNAIHYVKALSKKQQASLLGLPQGIHQYEKDVMGMTPTDLKNIEPEFLKHERQKKYGMEKEVHCLQKYEQLLAVIRSKPLQLKHFNKILKTLNYHVADFYQMFHPGGHPLVTKYRDLLICAVDHKKEDIARKLVRIKVDSSVREKYTTDEGSKWMTAEQRARLSDLTDLADYIRDKGIKGRPSKTMTPSKVTEGPQKTEHVS